MKGATEPLFTNAAYYKMREGLGIGALDGTLLLVSLSASDIILSRNVLRIGLY